MFEEDKTRRRSILKGIGAAGVVGTGIFGLSGSAMADGRAEISLTETEGHDVQYWFEFVGYSENPNIKETHNTESDDNVTPAGGVSGKLNGGTDTHTLSDKSLLHYIGVAGDWTSHVEIEISDRIEIDRDVAVWTQLASPPDGTASVTFTMTDSVDKIDSRSDYYDSGDWIAGNTAHATLGNGNDDIVKWTGDGQVKSLEMEPEGGNVELVAQMDNT